MVMICVPAYHSVLSATMESETFSPSPLRLFRYNAVPKNGRMLRIFLPRDTQRHPHFLPTFSLMALFQASMIGFQGPVAGRLSTESQETHGETPLTAQRYLGINSYP